MVDNFWFEVTPFELAEAKDMAEAINGGEWGRDYTDGQQRGWLLKTRWALGRYGVDPVTEAAALVREVQTECFRKAERAIREDQGEPYAGCAVESVRRALFPEEHQRRLEVMKNVSEERRAAAAARRTYEGIFEKQAKWILGPGLIGDLIEYARRGSLVVTEAYGGSVSIGLPSLYVRDEVTGRRVALDQVVPEALQQTWMDCLNEAGSQAVCRPEITRVLEEFLFRPMTNELVDRLNAELRRVERMYSQRENGALWQIVANSFGFAPHALPTPAGMAAP